MTSWDENGMLRKFLDFLYVYCYDNMFSPSERIILHTFYQTLLSHYSCILIFSGAFHVQRLCIRTILLWAFQLHFLFGFVLRYGRLVIRIQIDLYF